MNSFFPNSLALLTDLYQLTMAYGYWKTATDEQEAVFHLFYRTPPFGGQYAIAAGQEAVVEFLAGFHFSQEDLAYLGQLQGNDNKPMFEKGFLNYLRNLRLTCDVHALPEGCAVFPHQPILRVQGPLIQGQLLETALLNLINFPTLIATKASRICTAAQGEAVLEFGLRRAQGINGALTASRAAYIGGCAATSNVLAGRLYGIPCKGTHAHSWVMSFADEQQAFDQYAQAMPNNCVFLVDTYDTLQGVRNAVRTGLKLRQQGHEMVGIRLDSGDLAELSRQARIILDEAGLNSAAIVASNDLNEFLIHQLKEQGAKVTVWGVGTKLATAYEQPALGGVYKLAAIREPGATWQYKLKLSNDPIKISNPGVLQIRRFGSYAKGFQGDMLLDETIPLSATTQMHVLRDGAICHHWSAETPQQTLLQPILRQGQVIYTPPSLAETRAYAQRQLAALPEHVTRLYDPQPYLVGLEAGLYARKQALIAQYLS